MREQDRAIVCVGGQVCPQCVRIGRPAPLGLEALDVGAVGARDLREAISEHADRHGEHAIGGRERVDDRGLEAAGPCRREEQDLVLGPEEDAHPAVDPGEQGGELRPAMVDHLAPAGLANLGGKMGRAGNAEVGFVAVHGEPPGGRSVSALRARRRARAGEG